MKLRHWKSLLPVITTRGRIDKIYGEMHDQRMAYGQEIHDNWRKISDDTAEELRKEYQGKVDAEYQRTLRLCRGQLHRWAADGFYELFTQGALTNPRLRGMFGEAEKMLSPEKLKLVD